MALEGVFSFNLVREELFQEIWLVSHKRLPTRVLDEELNKEYIWAYLKIIKCSYALELTDAILLFKKV